MCLKTIDISSEPALPDWLKDVDARVQFGIQFGKSRGFIKSGDPVIVVTGWKQGSGYTNTMRIMYVEEELQVIDDVLFIG